MNKQVSIVVPTYNHEKYISRCLRSLINQNYQKSFYEIIVIDDGSTDNTIKILENLEQNKKILIRQMLSSIELFAKCLLEQIRRELESLLAIPNKRSRTYRQLGRTSIGIYGTNFCFLMVRP